jgi:hypothetical protein
MDRTYTTGDVRYVDFSPNSPLDLTLKMTDRKLTNEASSEIAEIHSAASKSCILCFEILISFQNALNVTANAKVSILGVLTLNIEEFLPS